MISALVNLEIGTAGQRDLDLDQNLAVADPGDGYSLNFHILFTVEDSCCHMSVH
jgi:hypothetical protein